MFSLITLLLLVVWSALRLSLFEALSFLSEAVGMNIVSVFEVVAFVLQCGVLKWEESEVGIL